MDLNIHNAAMEFGAFSEAWFAHKVQKRSAKSPM
jgi:hypothetical protein